MSALSLTSGCAARAGGERADGEAATAGEVGDERDASVAAGEGGSGEGGSAESLDGAALGAGGETADVEGALLIALGSVTPRETLSRSSVDGRFMENLGLTVWAGCWATTGELFGFATSANPSLADSLRSSASSAADILGSQPAARGGCALLSLPRHPPVSVASPLAFWVDRLGASAFGVVCRRAPRTPPPLTRGGVIGVDDVASTRRPSHAPPSAGAHGPHTRMRAPPPPPSHARQRASPQS